MIDRDRIIYDFKIPAGMADKEEGQDRLDFCLHVSVRCTFPATNIMKPIHALPHPLINSDYRVAAEQVKIRVAQVKIRVDY